MNNILIETILNLKSNTIKNERHVIDDTSKFTFMIKGYYLTVDQVVDKGFYLGDHCWSFFTKLNNPDVSKCENFFKTIIEVRMANLYELQTGLLNDITKAFANRISSNDSKK